MAAVAQARKRALLDQAIDALRLNVRRLHRANPIRLLHVEPQYGPDWHCETFVHRVEPRDSTLPPLWLAEVPTHLVRPPGGAGYEATRDLFSALRAIQDAGLLNKASPLRRIVASVRSVIAENALLDRATGLGRGLGEKLLAREILADRRLPEELRKTAGTHLIDRLFEALAEPIGAAARRKSRAPRPDPAELLVRLVEVEKLPDEELRRKPLEEVVGERCHPPVCGRTIIRAIHDAQGRQDDKASRALVELWNDLAERARPRLHAPRGTFAHDDKRDVGADDDEPHDDDDDVR